MKKHTNINNHSCGIAAYRHTCGREFIKNHKKEHNDKTSINVSENTCEDIPDTSISDTSISDTSVADTNTPDTSTSETDILNQTYENNKEQFFISESRMTFLKKCRANPTRRIAHSPEKICDIYMYYM